MHVRVKGNIWWRYVGVSDEEKAVLSLLGFDYSYSRGGYEENYYGEIDEVLRNYRVRKGVERVDLRRA